MGWSELIPVGHADIIDETGVNNLTLPRSIAGSALLKGVTGDSWQKQLTGKNLLNLGAVNKVANSITYTCGADGEITANGTAVGYSFYDLSFKLPAGKYILSGCPSGGSTSTYNNYLRKTVDGVVSDIGYDTGNGLTFELTETTQIAGYFARFVTGATANNITFYPMITLATEMDQTYEPYCGGIASPNPDYPQDIHSTGDSGWAVWEQGMIDSNNGSDGTSSDHVRTQLIPCKEGDVVRIECADWTSITDRRWIWLHYYDENGNWINLASTVALNTGYAEDTVPSGVGYFRFSFSSPSITPSTVGSVAVTINGQYALIFDEVGKNVLDDSSFEASGRGITYTKCYENDALYGYEVNGTVGDAFSEDLGTFYMNGSVLPEWAIPGVEYVASVNKIGVTGLRIQIYQNVNSSWQQIVATETSQTFKFSENATGAFIRLQVIKGYTMNNAMAYPMIRRCDSNGNPIGDDTYQPYSHNRLYIPISEPLRAAGDIKDEVVCQDGIYGVMRRIGRYIFDGSSDEGWSGNYSTTSSDKKRYRIANARGTLGFKNIATTVKGNIMSNMFSPANAESNYRCRDSIAIAVQDLWVYTSLFDGIDVTAWTNFLAENPMTFDYELATPTFTAFEDQTPFYSLKSFEGVTHISTVGQNENLSVSLDVFYPRTEHGADILGVFGMIDEISGGGYDAGYNTGYAEGHDAGYESGSEAGYVEGNADCHAVYRGRLNDALNPRGLAFTEEDTADDIPGYFDDVENIGYERGVEEGKEESESQLRHNPSTNTIQVIDTDGDWIDIYETGAIPVEAWDGRILGNTLKFPASKWSIVNYTAWGETSGGATLELSTQQLKLNRGSGTNYVSVLYLPVNVTNCKTLYITGRTVRLGSYYNVGDAWIQKEIPDGSKLNGGAGDIQSFRWNTGTASINPTSFTLDVSELSGIYYICISNAGYEGYTEITELYFDVAPARSSTDLYFDPAGGGIYAKSAVTGEYVKIYNTPTLPLTHRLLYSYGTEYVPFTLAGSLTKGDRNTDHVHIQIMCPDDGTYNLYGRYNTTEPIDVTDYNKLYITYKGISQYSGNMFGLGTDASGNNTAPAYTKKLAPATTATTVEIDITNAIGEYYIYGYADYYHYGYSPGEIYIYDIHLE